MDVLHLNELLRRKLFAQALKGVVSNARKASKHAGSRENLEKSLRRSKNERKDFQRKTIQILRLNHR
jgi:hypothetical protein